MCFIKKLPQKTELADPQNNIGKIVLVLFVVFLAFDLAPRILNPEQPAPETTNEASKNSAQENHQQKKEENFETQASYTKDTDPIQKDPFQRSMNTLQVSYCTS